MFRWWTCSAGRGWVKLGPMSVAWFPFIDVVYVLEIHWMNRLAWDTLV